MPSLPPTPAPRAGDVPVPRSSRDDHLDFTIPRAKVDRPGTVYEKIEGESDSGDEAIPFPSVTKLITDSAGTGDEWSLSSANEGDPHGYEASADEKPITVDHYLELNEEQLAHTEDPSWCFEVLFDYDAVPGTDELSLKAEDIVTVLERGKNGWWFGELREGDAGELHGPHGWMPAGYLRPAPDKFRTRPTSYHEQRAAAGKRFKSAGSKILNVMTMGRLKSKSRMKGKDKDKDRDRDGGSDTDMFDSSGGAGTDFAMQLEQLKEAGLISPAATTPTPADDPTHPAFEYPSPAHLYTELENDAPNLKVMLEVHTAAERYQDELELELEEAKQKKNHRRNDSTGAGSDLVDSDPGAHAGSALKAPPTKVLSAEEIKAEYEAEGGSLYVEIEDWQSLQVHGGPLPPLPTAADGAERNGMSSPPVPGPRRRIADVADALFPSENEYQPEAGSGMDNADLKSRPLSFPTSETGIAKDTDMSQRVERMAKLQAEGDAADKASAARRLSILKSASSSKVNSLTRRRPTVLAGKRLEISGPTAHEPSSMTASFPFAIPAALLQAKAAAAALTAAKTETTNADGGPAAAMPLSPPASPRPPDRTPALLKPKASIKKAKAVPSEASKDRPSRRVSWSESTPAELSDRRPSAEAAVADTAAEVAISASDVGQRVTVSGYEWFECYGVLRFFGLYHMTGSMQCGVEMDSDVGTHNGTVKGRIYFKCDDKHGLMLDPSRVTLEVAARDAAAEAAQANRYSAGQASLRSININYASDDENDDPAPRPRSIAKTSQPTRPAPPPPPRPVEKLKKKTPGSPKSPRGSPSLSRSPLGQVPSIKHVFSRRKTTNASSASRSTLNVGHKTPRVRSQTGPASLYAEYRNSTGSDSSMDASAVPAAPTGAAPVLKRSSSVRISIVPTGKRAPPRLDPTAEFSDGAGPESGETSSASFRSRSGSASKPPMKKPPALGAAGKAKRATMFGAVPASPTGNVPTKWQWRSDSGWVDFASDVSEHIDAALASGKMGTTIPAAGSRRFVIDLSASTLNHSTPIRCVPVESTGGSPTSVVPRRQMPPSVAMDRRARRASVASPPAHAPPTRKSMLFDGAAGKPLAAPRPRSSFSASPSPPLPRRITSPDLSPSTSEFGFELAGVTIGESSSDHAKPTVPVPPEKPPMPEKLAPSPLPPQTPASPALAEQPGAGRSIGLAPVPLRRKPSVNAKKHGAPKPIGGSSPPAAGAINPAVPANAVEAVPPEKPPMPKKPAPSPLPPRKPAATAPAEQPGAGKSVGLAPVPLRRKPSVNAKKHGAPKPVPRPRKSTIFAAVDDEPNMQPVPVLVPPQTTDTAAAAAAAAAAGASSVTSAEHVGKARASTKESGSKGSALFAKMRQVHGDTLL